MVKDDIGIMIANLDEMLADKKKQDAEAKKTKDKLADIEELDKDEQKNDLEIDIKCKILKGLFGISKDRRERAKEIQKSAEYRDEALEFVFLSLDSARWAAVQLRDLEVGKKTWVAADVEPEGPLCREAPALAHPVVPIVRFTRIEERIAVLPRPTVECLVRDESSAPPGGWPNSREPSAAGSAVAPPGQPDGCLLFRTAFDRARKKYSVPGSSPDEDTVFGALRQSFLAEGVFSLGDLREELRHRPPIQLLMNAVFQKDIELRDGAGLDGSVNPIRSIWGRPDLCLSSSVSFSAQALLCLEEAAEQVAKAFSCKFKDEIPDAQRRWPRQRGVAHGSRGRGSARTDQGSSSRDG